MNRPPRRVATYDDVIASPEHVVAELIEGVLYRSPRPASRHARAASTVGGELVSPFDRGKGGPGGWIILDEPEVHLGPDIVVPDVAGWRRSTLPELPDVAFFDVRPDWVCEVASPSTRALDRGKKLALYERAVSATSGSSSRMINSSRCSISTAPPIASSIAPMATPPAASALSTPSSSTSAPPGHGDGARAWSLAAQCPMHLTRCTSPRA